MKNFKFRLGLFNLMLMFIASMFLTSCEKQEITVDDASSSPESEISYEQQEGNTKIMLPQHITEKGEQAVKEYLQNISDEQKVGHINDYIMYDFFTKNGKLKDHNLELNNIGAYRDLDLSKHLSDTELNELNKLLIDIEDTHVINRGWCCYDVYHYSYSYHTNYYCWRSWCHCWQWCGSGWVDVYHYAYTVCYWC